MYTGNTIHTTNKNDPAEMDRNESIRCLDNNSLL